MLKITPWDSKNSILKKMERKQDIFKRAISAFKISTLKTQLSASLVLVPMIMQI